MSISLMPYGSKAGAPLVAKVSSSGKAGALLPYGSRANAQLEARIAPVDTGKSARAVRLNAKA